MTARKIKNEKDVEKEVEPTVVRQKVFSFNDKSSSEQSDASNNWSFKLKKNETPNATLPEIPIPEQEHTYTTFQKNELKTSMIELDFANVSDKKNRNEKVDDFSEQSLSLENLEITEPKQGNRISNRRISLTNHQYQEKSDNVKSFRYSLDESSSIDLPLASSEIRILAALIDYGVYFLFVGILYPLVISLQENEGWDPNNTILQQMALSAIAYGIYLVSTFLLFNNTLGKKICGILVKTDLGLSVDFLYYLIREILARFLLPLPLFSFIWLMLADKTIHDLLLKTRVIDRKDL